ncbi:MAG: hypothetical protein WDZ77_02065 [Candidatus Pacearchaeota archaeon]
MSKTKNYFLISFFILLIVGLFYVIFLFGGKLTGNIILESSAIYLEGEGLNGSLKISINEGELIPSSTKIILENLDSGKKQEYLLSEIINEEKISGDFYLKGYPLSGSGEGYGIKGQKVSYPNVSFKLNLYPTKESETNKEEVVEDQLEFQEEITGNQTNQPEINESEEVIQEEVINQTENSKVDESEKSNSTEEIIQPSNQTEESSEEIEKINESEEVIQEEVIKENETEEVTPTITGNVISNQEGILEGIVSYGNDFAYNLNSGQTAELILGSVKTNSENLSDSEINFKIIGNQIIITTEYSIQEEGFGEDFIKKKNKILSISLSELGFDPEGENLKISLIHKEKEIISLNTILKSNEIANSSESNFDFLNPFTNPQENEEIKLTEEEKELILKNLFGQELIVTKAEKTSKDYVFRFEIGRYWIEHHYSLENTNKSLTKKVEDEKIKFLKDISKNFIEQDSQNENLQEFLGSKSILEINASSE